MTVRTRGVEAHLDEAFGTADPNHFLWQTRHPVVGAREEELVRAAFLPLGERVLDLGCAEGATLRHLGLTSGAVGVDLFEDKLRFARSELPGCSFVRASAYQLPFEAGRFDHVLVRDVVHHVEEPALLFDECARVLGPGGRIDVLEPCRNNPLIALHALSNVAERGELRSSARFLRREVGRRFEIESVRHLQALPLHRLVFHPTLGRPELGDHHAVASAVDWLEAIAERVLPRALWAYLHVRARTRR